MYKDIAVIGMAGRFPMANSIAEFYQNLLEGRDCVREISEKRKSLTTIPEKEYQLLGYLDDIDLFDWEFFGISQREAEYMDPHQRLMLEIVNEVIENAGYPIDHLSETKSNLYISCPKFEYQNHFHSSDPTAFTGSSNSITAGKIARFYNLYGNALLVDTTCSSSLVSIYLACNDLILGEAENVIVCGASLSLFPPVKVKKKLNVGIDSIDGKAKAFSASANGTVGGEAVAAILLKPLSQAINDRDNIYAVIKAAAVNQDADRSSFLTAPSKVAQSEVIKMAWEKANIDPKTINYIEAHGTGTKIGDPIEIDGIDLAFKSFTKENTFCAVSSLKTNIGHTDAASGIAGLIKVILSLKHKVLFPSLHFSSPNPLIDFENSAVYINSKLTDWKIPDSERCDKRRAGISSFGLSGTNCHIVLEEAGENSTNAISKKRAYLITISSKKYEGLLDNIKNFTQYLSTNHKEDLCDISYTLNAGRKHYSYRYCAVVNNLENLQSALLSEFTEKTFRHAKDEPKLIFTFSQKTDLIDKLIRNFCKNSDLFNKEFLKHQHLLNNLSDNIAKAKTFIFQYTLYTSFQKIGVVSKKLLGIGVGDLVILVLNGKISLADAMHKIGNYKNEIDDLKDKLRIYVEKESLNKRLLFLEFGIDGEISNNLKELNHVSKYNYSVLNTSNSAQDPILNLLKALYLQGCNIDWKKYGSEYVGKRIELPTYQFQRKRCWVKEPLFQNLNQWFYQLQWEKQDALKTNTSILGKTVLIFMDDQGLGEAIASHFERNQNRCIRIYQSEGFEITAKDVCHMSWGKEKHYEELKQCIYSEGIEFSGIIHLGGCYSYTSDEYGNVDHVLMNSLYSQYYLTKIFDKQFSEREVTFVFITRNARMISGDEKRIFPLYASCHGFFNSLVQEYPQLDARCIDIDEALLPDGRVAGLIEKELLTADYKLLVGYRMGFRYVAKLDVLQPHNGPSNFIKEGGVYIITGGTSGIGLEICKYISKNSNITLIIFGRKLLPNVSEWEVIQGEDHNLKAIKCYKEIQQSGSKVYYFSLDIASRRDLNNALNIVKSKHGSVQGVIHSAGIPGRKKVKNHSLETFKETLQAKIHGTINLYECLKDQSLDFFVMFSSHNALIGSARGTNYSAANAFMESFVHQMKLDNIRGRVISWPSWQETGMWKRYFDQVGGNIPNNSILTKDGLLAFDLTLQNNITSTIISKENPNDIGENPYYKVSDYNTPEQDIQANKKKAPVNREMMNVYALPEIRKELMNIWYEILKIQDVKLDSNFFELGGNSLNGIQMIYKIEEKFKLNIEVEDIFDYPTISELATCIKSLLEKEEFSSALEE